MSIISAAFYVWELSGSLRKKSRTVFLSFALILTYAGLFLQIYEDNEKPLDIIQIVSEFFVILIVFEGKWIDKLWVYLKLNFIIGIGTIAGLTCVFIVYGDIKTIIYSENIDSQIIYYITVITVTGILCSMKNNKEYREKSILDNIAGMELSVCVMAGMLCLIYSIGIMLTEMDNDIELFVICGFFIGIMLMVVILFIINYHITKREELYKKYFVLRKLEEDGVKLKESIEKEEKCFENYFDILHEGVSRMYLYAEELHSNTGEAGRQNECTKEFMEIIIDEKLKKAKVLGVRISVKHDLGEVLYMKPMDLVSVVANLFDNAIEAAVNQGTGNVRINAYFKTDKADFYCFMENTYNGKISLDDGNFVTTKQNKENHGMGIKSVTEIVKRYGKTINIQAEKELFKVEIK